ncbi:hypothetical protein [Sphingomonas sp. S2-65]|uniref:hypothetical protein n=1 Tax=Sphingomonas sp. S2-65 TaxID=2903960 RepID=UPI001F2B2C74|nr:hypothetical protein [Sphingomonas sp. S2-65]UYY60102.1 hypothetical protein LZ586_08500 [Sphingomonas sp. S2-65]
MSIALPSSPGPASAEPAYLEWGGTLRPVFGGAMQKLLRLGDRFAIDVTMPKLRTEAAGRVWVSKLIQAQRQGAIFEWPQLGLDIGNPGAPRVNGGGQAGSAINLRGFAPGYQVRDGQFFSIIHGGRYYLEMATADVAADGGGNVVLPIAPMLRMQPGNGAICDFNPKIEGLIEGDSRSWTLDVARFVGLSFRIVEAK